MKIVMSSGSAYSVQAIKLYKADDVSQIASNRAKAAKALGPGATIVGVGGAPSLTLAAEATALSLVTGFLANVAAKQAIEQLNNVQAATELLLREMGEYVPVSKITNITLPYPASWSATASGVRFIHSADDFVCVQSEQGEACIRWSLVEAIQF